MTKFAPHLALKLITRGKQIFDERVVFHRVGCCSQQSLCHRTGYASRSLSFAPPPPTPPLSHSFSPLSLSLSDMSLSPAPSLSDLFSFSQIATPPWRGHSAAPRLSTPMRIPFSRFCRDPLYRGALCDPKGSMAFLQNYFRCPPIGCSKNLAHRRTQLFHSTGVPRS